MTFRAPALLLALVLASAAPAAAADWPLFGHDPQRSGVDASPPILSASDVSRLHARWQISFGGGFADSSPILLQNVRVAGIVRTMLYATVYTGVTFGIDAKTGAILWRTVTHGPSSVTDAAPAADPSGLAIYAAGIDGYVHKLSAATGRELRAPGFPAQITAMPQSEKIASALNVANGYLYATTSGFIGDAPPYDGHVVAVRLSDGATHVFNSLCSRLKRLPLPTSCNTSDSGIWGRGGAVVDPDISMQGAIYAATGNGLFDANTGGSDYGDSILSLAADASRLLGNYTPSDFTQLGDYDADLGSTSPGLLPREAQSRTPLMLVQGGKDTILRLVDRAHLPGVAGELQEISLPTMLFSSPAVWTDRAQRTWVFLGFSTAVQAYRLVTDASGISRLVGIWEAKPGQSRGEGTSPVVSNGILFVTFDDAIFALDARTGKILWSSAQRSARRTIGPVHWQSPIVVNGWLYCADLNGNLTAYSL